MHVAGAALPILCIASPTDLQPTPTPVPPAPTHTVDVWGGSSHDLIAGSDHRPRDPLAPEFIAAATQAPLGEGFRIVGSVAVLAGDPTTVNADGTGFGISAAGMAEISRRFIRAFGDDYDQIAVFLGFADRASPEALAYQLPVKNDVRGLGLNLFDNTRDYGSPSGRMQTMLNMKSINVYGLDAASNPENTLYPVWAQEAAHRWLTYFRFRRTNDTNNRDDLLGRQTAHWGPWVHAEGSVLDGVSWRENEDGTFSPVDRDKRFGSLDQYGMGLRDAAEVPPFFFLENITDEEGRPVDRSALARPSALSPNRRYRATKVNLTVQDIIRAVGQRQPASGGAALDLRMGVVYLTPPGLTAAERLGEAFLVDQTRAPWDDFYNAAGGGRGKVCTELLRPCRGPSFTFSQPVVTRTSEGVGPPSAVAPGQAFIYEVTVTNRGDETGVAEVFVTARFGLEFDNRRAVSPPLAPGTTASLRFSGTVSATAPCVVRIPIEHEAAGRLGPSRATTTIRTGLVPAKVYDFEDVSATTGWHVDPDGDDTATAGQWELGTPQKSVATILPAFVIQPGGAHSGTRAFVTGAAAGDNEAANDVDFDRITPTVGRTTLESPPIALTAIRRPRLSYMVYFVAVDFDRRVLVPAVNDNLHVLASIDGSAWTELDRVTGLSLEWQERLIDLNPLIGENTAATTLRLRFVTEDDPASDNVVEAVIDDVVLYGEAESCTTTVAPPMGGTSGTPDPPVAAGCGCQVGGANLTRGLGPGALTCLALVILVISRYRRRHPRLTKR